MPGPQATRIFEDRQTSSGGSSTARIIFGIDEEDQGSSLLGRLWDKGWKEFDWMKGVRDVAKGEVVDEMDYPSHRPEYTRGLTAAPTASGGAELIGSTIGSPLAVAGTGASIATGGLGYAGKLAAASKLAPIAKAAPVLAKGAKISNLIDRGIAGGTAIGQAPALVDAIRKRDTTKFLGTGFGIGMGILGAKALELPGKFPLKPVKELPVGGMNPANVVGPVSEFPLKPSYTLKNPSPRNISKALEEGYTEGPVLQKNKVPAGQIMEGSDTKTMLYPKNIATKVEAKYATGKMVPKKKLIKDAQGNPILDAEGKKTYEKFKKFKPTEPFPDVLKKWAGDRRAADIEAKIVKKDFADFDDKPLFDADPNNPGGLIPNAVNLKDAIERSKDFFKKKYGQLAGSGKQLGYREDYLPQMWDNTAAEVAEVFGPQNARLAMKKGFEHQRIYRDYAEGIEAGLKPKFDKLSDLTAFYEAHANKAIADRNFFQYLKDGKHISNTQTAGMVPIDKSVFPVGRTAKGQEILWQAKPEIAKTIEGFLKPQKTTFLGSETLGKANRFLKTSALSAGVPWTGINFHGLGLAARGAQATGNLGVDPKGFLPQLIENVKTLARPKLGEEFVTSNMQKAADYTRYGLQLPTEHINFRAGEKGETGFTGWAQRTFEDPLFQQAVPAFKIKTYETIRDNMVSNGVKFADASAEAAKQTNATFGSVDFKTMVANTRVEKTLKYLLDEQGSWFLAPQWLASHGYIAKDIAQAFKNPADPKGAMYRNMARNVGLAYTYANIMNKTASGRWMGENPEGHFFDIDTGQKDSKGKHIYVSPFGTQADFFRLPLDAVNKISSGQPLSPMARGRLGPVPQIGLSVYNGEDWSGKPLKTPADYGKLVGDYAPPYARAPFNLMSDKISPMQAVTDTFELPFRYRKK